MKVESSSYEAYLEALEEWKQKMQETQAAQQKEENSATDSYVPERRTPANAADAAAGDGRDRRDDGEHTGHGNDRDAGNRSDRNRGIA